MSKIKRAIVLPDPHVPVEDKATLAAVEAYMGECEWDYAIQLGDFLNLDCISRHTKDNLVAQTAETVQDEFDAGNAVLDRWDRILGPRCDKRLIEGNHDFRVVPYTEKNPQVRGYLNVPENLSLADRKWKWIPYWSKGAITSIGKASFIHGYSVSKNHPRVTYDAYQTNIFYGHVHDALSYSPVLIGKDNTPVAQSCGCLCEYDQSYIQGKPTKWQQAFLEFWFRPDGYFQYDVVRIFRNAFVRGGKLYDGRAILKGKKRL
jgi:hypothetical protein